ncbi:hypothetical protein [Aliterella atlantica]|uniref:Uncharacterized protein n=1 Tax=Aliterella atlantica CENA595 TaxID=1618023 RepID=A0A0D8ZQ75_9CYAN|nr:hypothetical protein [Aliterella atlantica]KJH70654.1 hypothetical protein UH38_16440 [Aliterella atlantica CENA595]
MTNMLSSAVNRISSLLKKFQVTRLVTLVLVGVLILTTNTNIAQDRNTQAVTKKLDEVVHQDNSDRPKTIGEWEREGQETENAPGERVKRIAKESAEAVKDFGSLYPDTAKRSARDIDEK